MSYQKRQGHRVRAGIFLFLLLCAISFSTFSSEAAKASGVSASPKKVALNKTKLTITRSRTAQLRLLNAKGSVTWKSSRRSVATVSKTGKVTAIFPGTCKITARYRGKTYRCTVKVYNTSRPYLPALLKKKYTPEKNSGKIILAGSSSFEWWTNASSALAPHRVINMGVAGTRVSDWQKLYSSLIVRYEPKAVVLYMGSNDIGDGSRGVSGIKTAARVQKLIQTLQNELPGTPIYYVSICPSIKRSDAWSDIMICNRNMRKYCAAKRNVYYLDVVSHYWSGGKLDPQLYCDKLHPSTKAYRIWGKVIKSALDHKFGRRK